MLGLSGIIVLWFVNSGFLSFRFLNTPLVLLRYGSRNPPFLPQNPYVPAKPRTYALGVYDGAMEMHIS